MFEPIIETCPEANITAVALDFQSETLLNRLQSKVKNIHFSMANRETDVVFVFTHLGEHFNPEKVAAYLDNHQDKFVLCVAIGEALSSDEQNILTTANTYFVFNPSEAETKAMSLLSVFDEIIDETAEQMIPMDFDDIKSRLYSRFDLVQISSEGQDCIESVRSQLSRQISNQTKRLVIHITTDQSLELDIKQVYEIMYVAYDQISEDARVLGGWTVKEDINPKIQVVLLLAK